MKILLVADFSLHRNGGIENHVKSLSTVFLNKYECEIDYLIGEEVSGRKILGKQVVQSRLIAKKIRQFNPHVVHLHGFASLFIASALKTALKLKKKTVYTPHYHPFRSLKNPLMGYVFFHLFQKPHVRQAGAVIVLTEKERQFYERFCARDRIHLIPNGIHMDGLQRHPAVRKREILFVGRNDHNKRLDFLLSQKDFFRDNLIDCNVVTNDVIADYEPFRFYNNLREEELVELYRTASVVCVPSKYEAFSLVALEALSHNTPVLASKGVQIKDYFNGEPFFDTFTYNNKSEFQRKLRNMLEYNHQIKKPFLAAGHPFDWAVIGEKVYRIYDQLRQEIS